MNIKKQKNVFGESLEPCSVDPLTGWLRDGCCNTDKNDQGVHTVCAKVTNEFLIWSKKVGNDLITPRPEFGFPGLKDGDNWCLCATWYARALEENVACSIYLKKFFAKSKAAIPKVALEPIVDQTFIFFSFMSIILLYINFAQSFFVKSFS